MSLSQIEEIRARAGFTALDAFQRELKAAEPFNIEGWIATARVAVDAYCAFLSEGSWEEQATESTDNAVSVLLEVATDVFHSLDGRVRVNRIAAEAQSLVHTKERWDLESHRLAGVPEFGPAVLLITTVSHWAATMVDDTEPCETLAAAYVRWSEESEAARWNRLESERGAWVNRHRAQRIVSELATAYAHTRFVLTVSDGLEVCNSSFGTATSHQDAENFGEVLESALAYQGLLVARTPVPEGARLHVWRIGHGRAIPLKAGLVADVIRSYPSADLGLLDRLTYEDAFPLNT
ncbi:hypothetical protein [Streptomyces sp. NPDC002952]|uniref:hypothetical protein n=1 Tax=Streptomyces sp. NPDC002952 TaxID=3364673 RepID=UPI0036A03D31